MALNYYQRLQNIQKRKYDPDIKKSILSESFGRKTVPENIEYLLESTKPIPNDYNQKTIEAANRVQKHLERDFNLHFSRAYRMQGSVRTKTNIKTHSDIDLLTIIDRYHFVGVGVPNESPYTASDPNEDIWELRKQATKILKDKYDLVDDSGSKCISIINQNLKKEVDIVFAYWLNSKKYLENNQNEYYRGIYLYDFPKKKKESDYPFATIGQVNSKGDETRDGSRKGIRLLKNLRADNESIDLNSFVLSSIVHSIDSINLNYLNVGYEINIAQNISAQLSRLIDEKDFRENITSPNGLERPLKDDTCVKHLKTLKSDLDQLIIDCAGEFRSHTIQKAILNY
jgi:hypothetical protein